MRNVRYNFYKIFILSIVFLLMPCAAFADGGAPLLLVVNLMAFLYGIVAIVAVEAVIQFKFSGSTLKQAVGDMFVVNIYSTFFIGGGLSLVAAVVGGILGEMPGKMGTLGLALGTWIIGDSMAREYGLVAVWATIFWLIVSYFVTVYYEAWCLNRRWERRRFDSNIPAIKLSWLMNSLTYFFLLLFFVVYWLTE